MWTIFYGNPAYVTFASSATDTRTLTPMDLPSDAEVRVIPWDNTPPFWLQTDSANGCLFSDHRTIEVPASPFRYVAPQKTLALLKACGIVFRVDECAQLCTDDGFEIALPDGLTHIKMSAEPQGKLIRFALVADKGFQKFLFVADKNKNWHVKIHAVCDKIEQKNGKTYVLCNTSSSGLIGEVTVYNSDYCAEDTYSVYTGKQATQDALLIIFDLIRCDQVEKARAYFTATLQNELSVKETEDFFKSYLKIEPAVGARDCYAFYTDERHGELYKAEWLDGKLNDLREIAHPLILN